MDASFFALLKAKTPKLHEWRHAFLVEHKLNQGPEGHDEQLHLHPLRKLIQVPIIPTYQAMRTQDYTYVEYETGGEGTVQHRLRPISVE